MSERVIVSEWSGETKNERAACIFATRRGAAGSYANTPRFCGVLLMAPCGDDGAVEGTRKEQSDGIAIVAQSADRVSHRERVLSRQKGTPHILWGVVLVQSKGLEPIRLPIGT